VNITRSVSCLLPVCLSAVIALAQDPILGRQSVTPKSTPAVADMTHEETVVRTAYAKFSYASELEAIGHLAIEADGGPVPKEFATLSNEQRLSDAQVIFKLSDFQVGNLSDILARKAVELIVPPIGEMLTAQTPGYGYGSDNGVGMTWYSVKPHWQPASSTSPEVQNATLNDLFEMEKSPLTPQWQRFAAYSVTVTFRGKSRGPYRALVLFGHDAEGNEMVMPRDGTTDSVALATVLALHLFPEPFVRSRLRSLPVVTNWLSAEQMSGSSCSVGQGDVCCDLIQLQCGPGRVDVTDALSKPLPFGEQ